MGIGQANDTWGSVTVVEHRPACWTRYHHVGRHHTRCFARADAGECCAPHFRTAQAHQDVHEAVSHEPSSFAAESRRLSAASRAADSPLSPAGTSHFHDLQPSAHIPVQLEDLVRSSPPLDSYMEDPLDRAVAEISSLATNMNEGKRESESRRKLVQWQARIKGRFPSPLVQPHR